MKPDTKKGIECYIHAGFVVIWNQEEGKYPSLFLSRTRYVITYANFPIIWESQIQTKIALSTMEEEYIAISRAMREVLPFVVLTKVIEFVLNMQRDTLMLLCSLFDNPVTVYKDNHGLITLTEMKPRTKHILIKYHHFQCLYQMVT